MRDQFARWSDPALTLTVGGVGITIPAPTIRTGLQLKAMYADLLSGESADIPDLPALLGIDTADLTGRLTAAEIDHVARTAAAWYGAGPALTEQVWHALDPHREAPEPVAVEPELLLGIWGWYDPAPGAYGADDPGGGDWNPHTGYRAWYNDAPPEDAAPPTLSWGQLFDHWAAVVCDFQQHYQVDLDEVADTRSIAWFETRLAGLQSIADSRIHFLTATLGGS